VFDGRSEAQFLHDGRAQVQRNILDASDDLIGILPRLFPRFFLLLAFEPVHYGPELYFHGHQALSGAAPMVFPGVPANCWA
jgi:hypothetical protein